MPPRCASLRCDWVFKLHIFITGIRGQLGTALAKRWPAAQVSGCDLPDCDISQLQPTLDAVAAARPQVVIHCAAWTDVDSCARDPLRAYQINAIGTQHVALAARAVGARLLLLSSNEVFDGVQPAPYNELDTPCPANPYGWSKLAAEWTAQHIVDDCCVVRSSWLFGHGGRNFVHRILELARSAAPLRVVTDETGAPTAVEDLADAIFSLIESRQRGIFHLVNSGFASRYELARAVLDLCGHSATKIEPTLVASFPRASTPPRNGCLRNSAAAAIGIKLRPWQDALPEFIGSLQPAGSAAR